MNGILVIDKPSGPTSFDVVRKVRTALGIQKAGHTGTLDPLATGVLPVCLGEATKVAGYVTEADKAYEAVVQLGVETDTLDAEGKVTREALVPPLNHELLDGVLNGFRGAFSQKPPMYSAVKVQGKRLYEHARAGKDVERQARSVQVYELTLVDFSSSELRLSLKCSKGFFVRVLAQDIGTALGCGAHLKALRRTQTGVFGLSQAVRLDSLPDREHVCRSLIPMEQALSDLPPVELSERDADRVRHGVPLEAPARLEGRTVRVMSPGGRLLAVAVVQRSRLRYRRVFLEEGSP